ncbi:MAG TPA: bifunctional sulfate adenylyltransferase/adenylylsulfate kinase [Vicinamibacterales bacterium]|nr:bifunctional sulfate adenylyltransferase/adenylylsulfate kinase [Vicinamibacterales bacterium]
MPNSSLIPGALVNPLVTPERAAELRAASREFPSWDLTPRQLCDLEMISCGAFTPLRGFLGRADYESVCASMRLAGGALWPIPISLDVPEAFATTLQSGSTVALRDPEGVMLAVLHVEDIWVPDREAAARAVFGTIDTTHPGVAALMREHPYLIGGRIEAIRLPVHHDFRHLRLTPAQVRAEFARRGWSRIVAFQTRNPMHRAHVELTLRAARECEAALLIQPTVGMTKPGDVDHYTRVRCYEAVLANYPQETAMLSLLPLAMRMGGPREAVLHAIIRRNYGCTHFVVGRDHAGPGQDAQGRPFYGPYDAQELLRAHQDEIGIQMVPFRMMVYVPAFDRYEPEDEVPDGTHTLNLSGTELRRRLAKGIDIPQWFTYPEVAAELQRRHPPRRQQGFTIFFTGLSGAGKSTIANVLVVKLLERGGRQVTLLDGDLVRKHLSSELGFSREHRDLNIRRIGYVASEITKNGGVAICAPIAPYDRTRKEVRSLVEPVGGFVLVHLSTSLAVCEERDRKGLYAKARAGIVQQFTGISDPYEAPNDAELTIDTASNAPDAAADQILGWLAANGYLDVVEEPAEMLPLEASA